MKLNRWDAKLLSICSDRVFEFARNASQDNRLFGLFRLGLVERKSFRFKSDSKGNFEYRWAYRLNQAGKDCLREISALPKT